MIRIARSWLALACTAGAGSALSAACAPQRDSGAAHPPAPRRIVSLNPTTTEILFTIGAGQRVVGRSRWDQWPAAARQVADVGDALGPNVERIVALHPDLVVLYASGATATAAAQLRALGVRTVSLRIDTVDEFERETRLLGRLVGDSARADTVADSVAATLDRVRRATAGLPHPRVVWPVADQPPIVIGRGSYMSELLAIAGATNVYADLEAPSPVVSVEDVVARAPDVVIAGGGEGDTTAWHRTWAVVPAVAAGHVVRVPSEITSRPSVQLGMAAVALAQGLHPGLTLR